MNAQGAAGTFAFTPATALTPGHSYRWWVGAISKDGTTFWSDSQDFAIAPLALPILDSPNGTNSRTTPAFSWVIPAGTFTAAAHYNVFVNDQTSGKIQVLGNVFVNGTTLTFTSATSLTAGHSYRWWVGAVSTNGVIFWSTPLDFTIAT